MLPSGAVRDAPVFVVNHRRSGVSALNVVTAALDADPRTASTPVVFAANPAEMIAAVRDAASRSCPVVTGWSFYSTDFAESARDLALVREATATLPVLHLAGGVHASAEPEQTLAAGFDLVALGEGETTVVELFAAIREGRDPRGLRGTAHRDADARFVSGGPGERRELDAFPAFNARHQKWNAIEITRGCIYACSFCQTPFLFKARFRHRSVQNVGDHVDHMAAHGSRYVRFVTPTCLSYGSADESVNLDAVEALLARVRRGIGPEGRLYFGTFPSEVRPEHVTPESLRILARYVTNRTLVIGGQSGSERLLREVHRGHDVDAVERAVRVSLSAGFTPDVDFLFGLPGETNEDRAASVALAERLVAQGARIHNHAFMPLPGTPLKDGAPSPLDARTLRALGKLEARGDLHGTWRRQLVSAEDLVRQRRAAVSSRGSRARPRSAPTRR